METYYRNIWKTVKSTKINTSHSSWYDYWHTHLDWDGKGNLGRWHRREHLRALFSLYARIKYQLSNAPWPYVLFILIDEKDSSQDAVYLHTENENNTPFPADMSHITWGIEPKGLLNISWLKSKEIGIYSEDGENIYYVREKTHNK